MRPFLSQILSKRALALAIALWASVPTSYAAHRAPSSYEVGTPDSPQAGHELASPLLKLDEVSKPLLFEEARRVMEAWIEEAEIPYRVSLELLDYDTQTQEATFSVKPSANHHYSDNAVESSITLPLWTFSIVFQEDMQPQVELKSTGSRQILLNQ